MAIKFHQQTKTKTDGTVSRRHERKAMVDTSLYASYALARTYTHAHTHTDRTIRRNRYAVTSDSMNSAIILWWPKCQSICICDHLQRCIAHAAASVLHQLSQRRQTNKARHPARHTFRTSTISASQQSWKTSIFLHNCAKDNMQHNEHIST